MSQPTPSKHSILKAELEKTGSLTEFVKHLLAYDAQSGGLAFRTQYLTKCFLQGSSTTDSAWDRNIIALLSRNGTGKTELIERILRATEEPLIQQDEDVLLEFQNGLPLCLHHKEHLLQIIPEKIFDPAKDEDDEIKKMIELEDLNIEETIFRSKPANRTTFLFKSSTSSRATTSKITNISYGPTYALMISLKSKEDLLKEIKLHQSTKSAHQIEILKLYFYHLRIYNVDKPEDITTEQALHATRITIRTEYSKVLGQKLLFPMTGNLIKDRLRVKKWLEYIAIDSKFDVLIDKIDVYAPSVLLKKGIILSDLPGFADSNVFRQAELNKALDAATTFLVLCEKHLTASADVTSILQNHGIIDEVLNGRKRMMVVVCDEKSEFCCPLERKGQDDSANSDDALHVKPYYPDKSKIAPETIEGDYAELAKCSSDHIRDSASLKARLRELVTIVDVWYYTGASLLNYVEKLATTEGVRNPGAVPKAILEALRKSQFLSLLLNIESLVDDRSASDLLNYILHGCPGLKTTANRELTGEEDAISQVRGTIVEEFARGFIKAGGPSIEKRALQDAIHPPLDKILDETQLAMWQGEDIPDDLVEAIQKEIVPACQAAIRSTKFQSDFNYDKISSKSKKRKLQLFIVHKGWAGTKRSRLRSKFAAALGLDDIAEKLLQICTKKPLDHVAQVWLDLAAKEIQDAVYNESTPPNVRHAFNELISKWKSIVKAQVFEFLSKYLKKPRESFQKAFPDVVIEALYQYGHDDGDGPSTSCAFKSSDGFEESLEEKLETGLQGYFQEAGKVLRNKIRPKSKKFSVGTSTMQEVTVTLFKSVLNQVTTPDQNDAILIVDTLKRLASQAQKSHLDETQFETTSRTMLFTNRILCGYASKHFLLPSYAFLLTNEVETKPQSCDTDTLHEVLEEIEMPDMSVVSQFREKFSNYGLKNADSLEFSAGSTDTAVVLSQFLRPSCFPGAPSFSNGEILRQWLRPNSNNHHRYDLELLQSFSNKLQVAVSILQKNGPETEAKHHILIPDSQPTHNRCVCLIFSKGLFYLIYDPTRPVDVSELHWNEDDFETTTFTEHFSTHSPPLSLPQNDAIDQKPKPYVPKKRKLKQDGSKKMKKTSTPANPDQTFSIKSVFSQPFDSPMQLDTGRESSDVSRTSTTQNASTKRKASTPPKGRIKRTKLSSQDS